MDLPSIYAIVSIPFGWMAISRLQRGFVFFTTFDRYFITKLTAALFIGWIVMPGYIIYYLVKAFGGTRQKRKNVETTTIKPKIEALSSENNAKPCYTCGCKKSPESIYCPQCGSKEETISVKSPSEPVGDIRRCSKCSEVLSELAKFCNHCGPPTAAQNPSTKPKCFNCAKEVAATAKYCPRCGQTL